MNNILLCKSFIYSILLSLQEYIYFFKRRLWFTLEFISFIGIFYSFVTLHFILLILFCICFILTLVVPTLTVSNPQILISSNEFTQKLSRCFSLKPFKSPIYLSDGIIQTINVFATRFPIKLEFDREFINGYDNGKFAVDWLSNQQTLSENSPILLVYHGLAGGSRESYIQRFVYYAKQKNYRIVVYTYRGCAGTKMTTPRAYNITCLEDSVTCINYIHSKYPTAPIITVGYSMGGMVSTTLCGRLDNLRESCNLIGCVAISATWPSLSTANAIPQVFMDSFTKSLVKIAYKNQDIFLNAMKEHKIPSFDYHLMDYVTTVPQFDNNFDCKLFGFGHYETYYYDIEQWYHFLPKSSIPLLAINSIDDPIAIMPSYTIQRVKNMVASSSNVIFILTNNGGHLGWVDNSNKVSFVDEATLEYCNELVKLFNSGNYKPTTF
ncbi:abhydrolase domain-containing protein, putative [Entamoeba dispar SAW760]|uniref:Abhydrolase domain-containing protein, putative n=1 Tax=Entamoeba dispar (strain ATCC PRA-260 / SAW760) TaxID=370354 RepID=B0ERM0_ENTDS|nr:abhydrolase domain-containing protein, putative [Entamoeba dispar SAW760]EDR22824.1 abhydrolase domain-containing protein, putative [Entamoeba dispar SAW760]|eukprot:EDR22824.1 abhydrolase domain-containing protein, putative [Entamoeba dispar SAW760]